MKLKTKLTGLLFICLLSISNINAQSQEGFIGEVKMFAGNFAPRGWAFCDGQLLSISQNTALFSILGTTYGGDGRTTFALPDLRGRTAIGPRSGPGLPHYRLGQKGGTTTTQLTINNLPSHSHFISAANAHAVVAVPALADAADTAIAGTNTVHATGESTDGAEVKNYNASDDADTTLKPFNAPIGGTITAGQTGNSQPANNLQPYNAINYIIALQGVFPSRS